MSNNTTSNNVTFDISPTLVFACKICSQTISIICIIILFLAFISFYYRYKASQMISFPVQLSIALLLNITAYLLPYNKPITYTDGTKEITIICRIQALCHYLSIVLTLNMLLIFYLLNYIIFINLNTTSSKKLRIFLYVVNWIIMCIFLLIGLPEEPFPTRLDYCRYNTSYLGPIVSACYSVLIIVCLIILFILIQCKVQQSIDYYGIQEAIDLLKQVRLYFACIMSFLILKIVSFFVKEGKRKNAIFVVDRLIENITTFFLSIIVCGKKGQTIICKLCRCKKKQIDQENKCQMSDVVEPVNPDNSGYIEEESIY